MGTLVILWDTVKILHYIYRLPKQRFWYWDHLLSMAFAGVGSGKPTVEGWDCARRVVANKGCVGGSAGAHGGAENTRSHKEHTASKSYKCFSSIRPPAHLAVFANRFEIICVWEIFRFEVVRWNFTSLCPREVDRWRVRFRSLPGAYLFIREDVRMSRCSISRNSKIPICVCAEHCESKRGPKTTVNDLRANRVNGQFQNYGNRVWKANMGDSNMGTEAEQHMSLKIHKVRTPWPTSHW